MSISRDQIKKLEDMDTSLLDKIDRIRLAVCSGEYSHAKMMCRTLEDDLHKTNSYANKLAESV